MWKLFAQFVGFWGFLGFCRYGSFWLSRRHTFLRWAGLLLVLLFNDVLFLDLTYLLLYVLLSYLWFLFRNLLIFLVLLILVFLIIQNFNCQSAHISDFSRSSVLPRNIYFLFFAIFIFFDLFGHHLNSKDDITQLETFLVLNSWNFKLFFTWPYQSSKFRLIILNVILIIDTLDDGMLTWHGNVRYAKICGPTATDQCLFIVVSWNNCSYSLLTAWDIYQHNVMLWQLDRQHVVQLAIVSEIFGELLQAHLTLGLLQKVHLDIISSLDWGLGCGPSGQTVVMYVPDVAFAVAEVKEEVVFLVRLSAEAIFAFDLFLSLFIDLGDLDSSSIVLAGVAFQHLAINRHNLELNFSELYHGAWVQFTAEGLAGVCFRHSTNDEVWVKRIMGWLYWR